MRYKTLLERSSLEPLEARIAPATFLVTTTADSGPSSLRQAILDANAAPGYDYVRFDFPTTPVVFMPTSALPTITDPTSIQGDLFVSVEASPPRYIISGLLAGNSSGLRFSANASGSNIEGLAVSDFHGNGIEITSANNIRIHGCTIGAFQKNSSLDYGYGNTGAGIRIASSSSVEVGIPAWQWPIKIAPPINVIGGNGGPGIHISGGGSHSITGNLIGLTREGLSNPNDEGILIESSSTKIGGAGPFDGNVISGNKLYGIRLISGTGNVIQGNHIGTDISGTKAVPNGNVGVRVQSGTRDTMIGGPNPGEGNLISGNAASGIYFSGGGDVAWPADAKVQGNLIGTDVTGTKALPNKNHGIHIERRSSILIGGDTPGARNVISANGSPASSPSDYGIVLRAAELITIQQNHIGTDITGTGGLGNRSDGIAIYGGKQIQIGGHTDLQRNIISGNGGYGISFGVLRKDPDYSYGATKGAMIENNHIGLSSQGAAIGNELGGIYLGQRSESVWIYGGKGGWRNVISGNKGPGIIVDGQKHFIHENFIGLNGAGSAAIGNQGFGIEFKSTSKASIVRSNFIAGNGAGPSKAGILANGESHIIDYNRIGFDVTGTVALGNGGPGIAASGTSQILHNKIAGYGANDDIDRLVKSGIRISGGRHVISDNVIEHVHTGISVSAGQDHHLIGNSIFDSRRGIEFDGGANGAVISQNTIRTAIQYGIGIAGNYATITENLIESTLGSGIIVSGADAVITGNIVAHTGDVGMRLTDLNRGIVEGNTISDFQNAGIQFLKANVLPTGIVRDNHIRDGDGPGIRVEGGNFELTHNLIYGNSGIAIDLGGDGITPNDPEDADTGPNVLQNTVTFRSAVLRDGQVIVRGSFDGAALRALRVEFFAIQLDEAGTEVSAQFLSETMVETDASGHAMLSASLPLAPERSKIVATVTDVTDHITSEAASTTLIVAPEVVAVGTGAGAKGTAKTVRASDLSEIIAEWKPYGEKFRGGVHVAHADIDGDGLDDLITAPATNGRMVRVFSGFDGTMLTEWEAAPRGHRSGISIAAGDVDGDGSAEIVTALGFGLNSTVTVRDAMTGDVESSFLAFGKTYRSGLNLSMGDLDSDGDDDIVASLQSGVALVRAFTGTGESLSPLIRPFAGQASIGAFTAVIPATPESAVKIAVGSGVGARGAVEFFDVSGSRLMQLPAFDGNRFSGLRLASADVDADGIAEIIVARGPGHMPRAEVIGGGALPSTVLFAPALRTGLFLG